MDAPAMPDCHALVAVIDGYEPLRNAVVRLLRSTGYSTSGHGSAEAFLASAERPAALVLDIQLPGLGGLELLALLSAEGRAVPAVVISACPDELSAAESLAAGAMAMLVKPFDADVLVDAVAAALRSPSPHDPPS